MQLSFRSLSSSLLIILATTSCGPKEAPQSIQMSRNRKMAVVLREIQPSSSEARAYYESLLNKALEKTYSPDLKVLNISEGPLESPENLFRIADAEIDDLFLVEVKTPSGQYQPRERPEESEQEEALRSNFPSQAVELNGRIINGSNLRTVSLIQMSVPWDFRDGFEEDFVEIFKKAALGVFANPNVYPQSDPLHFANLLYVYSNRQEKESEEALTCRNAQHILSFYEKAHQLFVRARDLKRNETAVGAQEEAHELSTRLEHSKEKAKILQKCQEDEKKTFELNITYGNIDPSYQSFIEQAIAKVKLENLLQKYTNKPVKMNFQLNETGLDLTLWLRYDSQRYVAWTKDRIPRSMGSYHVVSLDPYYALMQTLVLMKYYLPTEAPQPLKLSFQKMSIDLVLDTLLNGQLSFSVAGSYLPDDKRVRLAFPKSVYLTTPGYESKTIFARSEEVFQEKGWLTFSSCKTLDGTMTEDGLLMRFLGLDCKV